MGLNQDNNWDCKIRIFPVTLAQRSYKSSPSPSHHLDFSDLTNDAFLTFLSFNQFVWDCCKISHQSCNKLDSLCKGVKVRFNKQEGLMFLNCVPLPAEVCEGWKLLSGQQQWLFVTTWGIKLIECGKMEMGRWCWNVPGVASLHTFLTRFCTVNIWFTWCSTHMKCQDYNSTIVFIVNGN